MAAASHAALVRISGTQLLSRKSLWETWLEGERAWGEERLTSVLASAGSDDEETAQAGLRHLAGHRLHRASIVRPLEPTGLHPSAAVRRQACETLGALGSPLAFDMLRLRLDDTDPAVVASASAALESVTGLLAPSDPDDWKLRLLPGY